MMESTGACVEHHALRQDQYATLSGEDQPQNSLVKERNITLEYWRLTCTCGVMGTASTMACILVGLGLMPFNGASAPAVSAARLRIAESTGVNAVAAFKANLRPQALLTEESFENAITVLQAIGGSTNAVVHLMAIVGRHWNAELVRNVNLNKIDQIGKKTPLLVDLKPSGDNYVTDFHNSGGMRALLEELRPLIHLNA